MIEGVVPARSSSKPMRVMLCAPIAFGYTKQGSETMHDTTLAANHTKFVITNGSEPMLEEDVTTGFGHTKQGSGNIHDAPLFADNIEQVMKNNSGDRMCSRHTEELAAGSLL